MRNSNEKDETYINAQAMKMRRVLCQGGQV
jgi:hypothetical protein